MNFNSDLLCKLVNTYGPSGNEEKIRDFIKSQVSDYVDEINVDSLGNLIVRKSGTGKKIMVAAHMDQIGLMITDIDDKGFLRFTNLGGISALISLGQKVVFENGIHGVISCEPLNDIKELKLEKMYIDIGALDEKDAKEKVNIGDICIYDTQFIENENFIISKCLDDRVGCFVAIETIKELKDSDNDIYFVFTTQEEVGLRGAKTAAYSINPDIGIAIDVTGSGDTPKAKRFAVGLNKGTAIKVKDNSILTHPRVKKLMINIAEQNNIPYQLEVLEHGGTDSGSIHLTREGIPSGVISIPTRNVHSLTEIVAKNDIINSKKLLIRLLQSDLNI